MFKLLFFSFLIFGSLIAISSYSWFGMWIGLEINLLSIIPLLKSPQSLYPSESAMKYFITQSLASMVFLFSILMLNNLNEFIFSNLNFFLNLALNSALLLKVGMAPFHSWFPEVMEGLNWSMAFTLLTWQKLSPMVILMYSLNTINFLVFIIISSAMVSGILGLNQISLRKILAYSSINHMAWMLASILYMKMIWFWYFCIYFLILVNIIVMLEIFQIFYLKQLFNSMNQNKLMKLFFILNFFNLGGLPPFLGFLPKWLISNNLIENNFFFVNFILIIFTLIPLFFYMRMTFSTLTFFQNEFIFSIPTTLKFWIILLNSFTLAGLLVCTSILSIF
uniref:NADH-ubiquinone oxidoreductase chain 2 n=1 Tax=Leptinotarsa decemlineata TaxID=7539 RepID=A0A8F6U6U1_LEPDE|nr:NADH dehydrogenase subunit 2 [Leptinotarsa decemlineata]